MKVDLKFIILILSVAFLYSSCEKETETMTVEGFIRDEASLEPIAGIQIFVDAMKSPSGMGLLGGRRENVGQGTTDSKGYYKVKLKVFKDAENLELFINGANQKEGYISIQPYFSLSSLNRSSMNTLDFTLSPIAVVKIKYKNLNPVSDNDFFYFSWYPNGGTKGIVKNESCGTVVRSEAATWTGRDVCGQYTIDAIAEKFIHVYWTVKKNNVTRQYNDSIFVKRGVISNFLLNY